MSAQQEEIEMQEQPKNKAGGELNAYLQKSEDARYRINASEVEPVDQAYLSETMMELREVVKQYKTWTMSRHQSDQDRDRLLAESLAQFAKVCNSLKDYGEILMALYLCVRYFGS